MRFVERFEPLCGATLESKTPREQFIGVKLSSILRPLGHGSRPFWSTILGKVNSPPMLEPISVVGLGCSLGVRGFDPWPLVEKWPVWRTDWIVMLKKQHGIGHVSA